jgi:S-adenosyl-L-methionine hydrolase (adenosine-forming)
MKIITLISDLGTADYYAGMIKGHIYQALPDVRIVDITHQIEPFNIVQAAYTLQQSYRSFAPDTLHIVLVSNHDNPDHAIAFQHKSHRFIGPNNGLFSLAFDDVPDRMVRLPFSLRNLHQLRERLGLSAKELIQNDAFLSNGPAVQDYLQKLHLHPVVTKDEIRGSIIHIDNFGNVVINIREVLFEHMRKNRQFELYFKRNNPVTKLTPPGSVMDVGEIYCHFNDSGYLEIGINMGNASELLGLRADETVQIQFVNQ